MMQFYMKTLLLIILILHGGLHLVGFYRAYVKADVVNLSRYISKPFGALWMLSGILFLFVAVLILMNLTWWPYFAIAAVILSQALIFLFWKLAKYGTFFNVVILFYGISAFGVFQLEELVD